MTKPICRDTQIALLKLYLGLEDEDAWLPEVVLVQGVGGTGKTVTLRWLLSHHFIPHAFVDCIECYQPKLLFQSILTQLSSNNEGDNIKCDNVSDFTRMMSEVLGDNRYYCLLNGQCSKHCLIGQ